MSEGKFALGLVLHLNIINGFNFSPFMAQAKTQVNEIFFITCSNDVDRLPPSRVYSSTGGAVKS